MASLRDRRRNSEKSFWIAASAVIAVRFLYLATTQTVAVALTRYYMDLIVGSIILVFPTLYDLTFGRLPFEQFRRYLVERRYNAATKDRASVTITTIESETSSTAPFQRTPRHRALAALQQQALSSRQIADNLYRRSGVYLIVGGLIAFSGLGFFYTQTSIEQTKKASVPVSLQKGVPVGSQVSETASSTLLLRFAELAPRFGILFFIELIAFFFLRQYRSALDEFRHFEALKRHREELVPLLHLIEDSDYKDQIIELVMAKHYFSAAGTLAAGETTELLETRKLSKDELAIFEGIVAAIGARKPASALPSKTGTA